jgi:mono/diheme cytochrome c family protein
VPHRSLRLAHVALALSVLLARTQAAAQDPPSEETLRFFATNCASCHTIGGGALMGPDLAGSSQRADREWQARFIRDPKAVIDSGDPYALRMVEAARGVVMPKIPGIDAELARKLVELIDHESGLERSRFAGVQLSERPLTAQDFQAGRALFLGGALASGGPACVACHTTSDLGLLGGGTLGPDLTAAYARLEGRKALGAWLAAPPSPVMQPLYRDRPLAEDEILGLIAYLEGVARTGRDAAPSRKLAFVLGAIGLAALLLVLMEFAWRKRFRGVRRALVAASRG